jgi:O-methyltransferase
MSPKERECFANLIIAAPKGPRIELGVFRGATLALMMHHDDYTYGVDTFEGMPPPSPERDIKDGVNPYPTGRLKAKLVSIAQTIRDHPRVQLIQGTVPEILPHIPDNKFAFAHVDMDQYDSTFAALEWLWPRMITGGIICCDDWFSDRDWLAAGAINQFARETVPLSGYVARKAWFIK